MMRSLAIASAALWAVLLSAFSARVALSQETTVDCPVAFVNSEEITKSQVDRRLALLAERSAAPLASQYSFDQALEMEIDRTLVLQAAEKEFEQDYKDRLRKRAEEISSKRGDPRVFRKPPDSREIDLYYRDLLLQVYVQKKVTVANAVTPAEVKEYYEANKEAFGGSRKVVIREILVRAENRTPEEARALIDRVSARLAAGEDFTAVAAEVSQSSYAALGGLWPAKGRGDLVAEVEKAAFQMKPGEVCQPFKSPLGWHVVRLESEEVGQVRPFAEVQQTIYQQLADARRKEAEARLIGQLRSRAVIRKSAG